MHQTLEDIIEQTRRWERLVQERKQQQSEPPSQRDELTEIFYKYLLQLKERLATSNYSIQSEIQMCAKTKIRLEMMEQKGLHAESCSMAISLIHYFMQLSLTPHESKSSFQNQLSNVELIMQNDLKNKKHLMLNWDKMQIADIIDAMQKIVDSASYYREVQIQIYEEFAFQIMKQSSDRSLNLDIERFLQKQRTIFQESVRFGYLKEVITIRENYERKCIHFTQQLIDSLNNCQKPQQFKLAVEKITLDLMDLKRHIIESNRLKNKSVSYDQDLHDELVEVISRSSMASQNSNTHEKQTQYISNKSNQNQSTKQTFHTAHHPIQEVSSYKSYETVNQSDQSQDVNYGRNLMGESQSSDDQDAFNNRVRTFTQIEETSTHKATLRKEETYRRVQEKYIQPIDDENYNVGLDSRRKSVKQLSRSSNTKELQEKSGNPSRNSIRSITPQKIYETKEFVSTPNSAISQKSSKRKQIFSGGNTMIAIDEIYPHEIFEPFMKMMIYVRIIKDGLVVQDSQLSRYHQGNYGNFGAVFQFNSSQQSNFYEFQIWARDVDQDDQDIYVANSALQNILLSDWNNSWKGCDVPLLNCNAVIRIRLMIQGYN